MKKIISLALISMITLSACAGSNSYAEQIGLGTQHYTLIDLDQMTNTSGLQTDTAVRYNVYTLDGKRMLTNATSLKGLKRGTYIVNGEMRVIE